MFRFSGLKSKRDGKINQLLTHMKHFYIVMYTKHIISITNGILHKMYIIFNVEKRE